MRIVVWRKNKPRTAKVGAISKAQNLKAGFVKLQLVAKNLKKLKGGSFGDMKKFPKKIKWDFLTSIVLQNIETNEGGPSGAIQKTSKKSHSAEKKWG